MGYTLPMTKCGNCGRDIIQRDAWTHPDTQYVENGTNAFCGIGYKVATPQSEVVALIEQNAPHLL